MKKSFHYNVNTLFLLSVVVCILSGCKKFVQVGAPNTELVTATVFSNASSATSAQLAIYSEMLTNLDPYFIDYYTGLSADELTNYSTSPIAISFYTNSLNALNANSSTIWTNAYSYIYQANAVIQGLQGSISITSAIKQQLIGEAKFIRSYWYFYLVNLFGDVPLALSPDYNSNANLSRSSVDVVYQQIINDLKDAQNNLNSNYVDVSDTTITTDKVRPTKWAATALLARVYLYTGDYADAVDQATTVINNNSLYTLSSINGVFLANSAEAIWQLMPATSASFSNTPEGYGFILTSSPLTNLYNSSTLSTNLLNAFEPGDNRRVNWVDSIVVSGVTYYFPSKYKVLSASPATEYSTPLRLAEQYLIRAEAEANGSGAGPTAAVTDLNIIRVRAGLPNYSGPTDPASILEAIYREQRIELFTEWGHRWLDLKRTKQIDSVMSTITPLKNPGGSWSTTQQLYPIPQTERTSDPNLSQNPGY